MHTVLRHTTFDPEHVHSRAVGGGILPVARRADGDVCFLLAKEQHIPSWRGSFKWSAFEGGRHAGETIEDTATREWREESLNSVCAIAADALRAAEYVCRFTLNVVHARRAYTASDRYHVMFAVEVPYDTQYVDAFRERRNTLLTIQRLSSDLATAESNIATTDVAAKAPRDLVDVVCDAAEATFVYSDGERTTYAAPFPPQVREWLECRQSIERLVPHDGVTVHRDVSAGVLRVAVNPDYLEKERLRWWTIDELKQVLQNGGRLQDEQFRAYFLPVLDGMVEFFSSPACRKRAPRAVAPALQVPPPPPNVWNGVHCFDRAAAK